jgi:hypothetical protein
MWALARQVAPQNYKFLTMNISKLEKPRFIEGHDIRLHNYNYHVDVESADRLMERWKDQGERLAKIESLIQSEDHYWCQTLQSPLPLPYSDEVKANGGIRQSSSNETYEYKRDLRGIEIKGLVVDKHYTSIHYSYFDFSTFDKCRFEFSSNKDMFFFKNSLNNTKFTGCSFKNGWFFEGEMVDSIFYDCDFEDVIFNANSIEKSNYRKIVFINCKFKKCDLSKVDLSSCIFVGDCSFESINIDAEDLNSFSAIGIEILKTIKIWDKEHWKNRKYIQSVTFPGVGEPIVNKMENGKVQPKSKNNIIIRMVYSGLIDFYEFAADKYDNQKGRGVFSRAHFVLSWLIDEKSSINNKLTTLPKYFISRWVAGYGDRPESPITAWLLSVALFAVLLGFSGIEIAEHTVTFFDQCSFNEVFTFYMKSLYFSVITATTVGYGDIGPSNGISMALSALNAIIGMFLYTTFTVVMVRRLFR